MHIQTKPDTCDHIHISFKIGELVTEVYSGQDRHTDRQTLTDPNPRLAESQLWPTIRDPSVIKMDFFENLKVRFAPEIYYGIKIMESELILIHTPAPYIKRPDVSFPHFC